MNRAMSDIKKLTVQQRVRIKTDFDKSMKLAKIIFDNWAFRKSDKFPDKRKPINKALFEVWSVLLAKLDDSDRGKLEKSKKVLFKKSVTLTKSDSGFFDSITTSTGNKSCVIDRFTKIDRIIKETLSQ
jgi:hypothetical protein